MVEASSSSCYLMKSVALRKLGIPRVVSEEEFLVIAALIATLLNTLFKFFEQGWNLRIRIERVSHIVLVPIQIEIYFVVNQHWKEI